MSISVGSFASQLACRMSLLSAAESGDLAALQKAHETGVLQMLGGECVITHAFLGRHFECLVFAREHGCQWPDGFMEELARDGQLKWFQYAHEHGCPWTTWTLSIAIAHDNVECVRYACGHGCPWSGATTAFAAKYGKDACLQILHEQGCPWDERVTFLAAQNGHLACLQYACEHECPWSTGTTEQAAARGHLACLRYAHENGCWWNHRTLCVADQCGHDECFVYAYTHGCPTCSHSVSRAVRLVLLPKWRRAVRARAIAMYWYDRAGRTACGPGGAARARHRLAFEADFGRSE